jgi:hypothetical protein
MQVTIFDRGTDERQARRNAKNQGLGALAEHSLVERTGIPEEHDSHVLVHGVHRGTATQVERRIQSRTGDQDGLKIGTMVVA